MKTGYPFKNDIVFLQNPKSIRNAHNKELPVYFHKFDSRENTKSRYYAVLTTEVC